MCELKVFFKKNHTTLRKKLKTEEESLDKSGNKSCLTHASEKVKVRLK